MTRLAAWISNLELRHAHCLRRLSIAAGVYMTIWLLWA